MKRIEYQTGQEINGLVFIKEVEPHVKPSGRKERKAIFRCGCGNEFDSQIVNVKNGNTNSCGCWKVDQVRERFTTHGLSGHPLHRIWRHIKQRCNNPNDKGFQYYGGRGISICEEWSCDPEEFIRWALKNGYKKGLAIDRTNNDGNYEPSNCRFVTQSENNQNRVRGVA